MKKPTIKFITSGTELDDIDVSKIVEVETKSAETTWKLITGG
jgi:hypothetical protein